MEFPVYLAIGSWRLHPHPVCESLGYFFAWQVARRQFRNRSNISAIDRTFIMLVGLLGGLIGAKLLAVFQHLDDIWMKEASLVTIILTGKTVVGGLLGATFGVELAKKVVEVKTSTGDAFAYPLIVGTAIGRVGCFLTGLDDRTYGIPTSLPWAIDFGDGIPRHPTQIYEILFLAGLFAFLKFREKDDLLPGDLFRFYSIAYLGFRWMIDFLKPDFHPWLGMTAIQIACLLGLFYYRKTFSRIFKH
jgi:prolipoprotein diacylglyceryltransferase